MSLSKAREVCARHLRFVGPGLVAAVAYIDPGNWATDLQAGANYGYKLLFVVLVAGLAAVVLQTLAVRIGTTTATSLPHQTRLLFLRLKVKYPKWRIPLHCCLWAMYIMAEVAIIATDLAELIGSAVALSLLFPSLPLWAGVLITAVDILIVLAFFNSNDGRRGMLFFEILIVVLVLAVFVSFAILLHLIKPEWKEVFFGLLPSSTLLAPGATYTSIGIIGATVMPHALFLGSSLASVDRLDMVPRPPVDPSTTRARRARNRRIQAKLPSFLRFGKDKKGDTDDNAEGEYELESIDQVHRVHTLTGLNEDAVRLPIERSITGREAGATEVETEEEVKNITETREVVDDDEEDGRRDDFLKAMKAYEAKLGVFNRIRWVDLHLRHASVDTILSLLGFALTINAAILTLAGAAFYYSDNGADADDATLQGAHALLSSYIGRGAGTIFALALLCAGQSASITATLAGQVVSEGFINWRTSPFWRRLITRLIGVIPAAAVAAAVGPAGLNTMLVASQVLLSIVLPTVIFPLVYLCSREDLMTVHGPEVAGDATTTATAAAGTPASTPAAPTAEVETSTTAETSVEPPRPVRPTKIFTSPKWQTWMGYVLFAVIVVANCYVIVQLGLGNT